jgi:hypothetical protein
MPSSGQRTEPTRTGAASDGSAVEAAHHVAQRGQHRRPVVERPAVRVLQLVAAAPDRQAGVVSPERDDPPGLGRHPAHEPVAVARHALDPRAGLGELLPHQDPEPVPPIRAVQDHRVHKVT